MHVKCLLRNRDNRLQFVFVTESKIGKRIVETLEVMSVFFDDDGEVFECKIADRFHSCASLRNVV